MTEENASTNDEEKKEGDLKDVQEVEEADVQDESNDHFANETLKLIEALKSAELIIRQLRVHDYFSNDNYPDDVKEKEKHIEKLYEMEENLSLSLRSVENSRMRLTKVMQAKQ